MVLAIDATISGADSNSYCAVADASEYFAPIEFFSTTWLALTDAQKIGRLIVATRAIDRMLFIGRKADTDQALEFPRNIDNTLMADLQHLEEYMAATEIPVEVVAAQCEMVIFQYLQADSVTGQAPKELDNLTVPGVVAMQFSAANHEIERAFHGNMDSIKALLRNWLANVNTIPFRR